MSLVTRSGIQRAVPPKVAARAATSYTVHGECWISTYSLSRGYAQIGWRGEGRTIMVGAHRAAWTHWNGPIPDPMTVDHIRAVCTSRRCVNPDHLRLLTNVENARDNGGEARRTATPCGLVCGQCGDEKVATATGEPYCRPCSNRRKWKHRARSRVRQEA